VNAGHNPPLLVNTEGSEWLKAGCMGLGMLDEIPQVRIGQTQVPEGSILTCFTDGLVEVENNAREEYGDERLNKIVMASHSTMAQLNEAIRADFDEFRGSNPPHDDFALLSVRFR
jgi:sigma-B regulation protein RsbU (phosphoserine phosphatase)